MHSQYPFTPYNKVGGPSWEPGVLGGGKFGENIKNIYETNIKTSRKCTYLKLRANNYNMHNAKNLQLEKREPNFIYVLQEHP